MKENKINNSVSNKKIETVNKTDHNPLFTKFWQELRAGKGIEKGETDVEEMVTFYTNVKPLSSLSEEETEKIKEHLRLSFTVDINIYNSDYRTLINDEIFLVNSRRIDLLNVFNQRRGGC